MSQGRCVHRTALCSSTQTVLLTVCALLFTERFVVSFVVLCCVCVRLLFQITGQTITTMACCRRPLAAVVLTTLCVAAVTALCVADGNAVTVTAAGDTAPSGDVPQHVEQQQQQQQQQQSDQSEETQQPQQPQQEEQQQQQPEEVQQPADDAGNDSAHTELLAAALDELQATEELIRALQRKVALLSRWRDLAAAHPSDAQAVLRAAPAAPQALEQRHPPLAPPQQHPPQPPAAHAPIAPATGPASVPPTHAGVTAFEDYFVSRSHVSVNSSITASEFVGFRVRTSTTKSSTKGCVCPPSRCA